MEKIKIHSATPIQEMIDFVNRHKGKKIELHFAMGMYEPADDDGFFVYDTSITKHYNELIETIKKDEIRGIELVK